MSMQILTIVQFAVILCIYTFLVVIFPAAIFCHKFEGKPLSVRFMAYVTIGNFYIMNLVFILELMHISCIYTLIAGTVIPAAIAIVRIYGLKPKEACIYSLKMLTNCMRGTVGIKFIAANLVSYLKKIICPPSKRLIFRIFHSFADCLCTVFIIVVVFYSYGINMTVNYGYCASDLIVHNYWINELGNNNIFVAGVYPFGFHCVIYYMHEVFGIDTYVILRLFCVVQTLFIHLVLLSFLRACCKSRYLPYITVALFATFPLIRRATYERYLSSLPQEFGIIFILPSIYFIFAFFKVRKKELLEENIQEGKRNTKRSIFAKQKNKGIENIKTKSKAEENGKGNKWKISKRNGDSKRKNKENKICEIKDLELEKESKNSKTIENIYSTEDSVLDDSLAVCRNIKKRCFEDEVYSKSTDKIFEDISKSINQNSDGHPWERVLDEILSENQADLKNNYIQAAKESNYIRTNIESNYIQTDKINDYYQTDEKYSQINGENLNDGDKDNIDVEQEQNTESDSQINPTTNNNTIINKNKVKEVFNVLAVKLSIVPIFLKTDSNLYLTLFAMCFSMTLAVHFYGTMVAGLYCIGVAVGYCFRLFRKGYFGRVMLAGFASIFIAILPMFIAYAGGTKLQGSLGWGMEIIMGKSDYNNQEVDITNSVDNANISNSTDNQNVTANDNIKEFKTNNISSNKNGLKLKIANKVSHIYAKLSTAAGYMAEKINEYVIESDISWKKNLVFLGIVYTFILGVLLLFKKEKDYGSMVISSVIGILFMITILCAGKFGIPALMDGNRGGVYTAYLLPIIFAFGLDGTIWLLFSFIKPRWVINTISLIVSAAILVCVCTSGLIRESCIADITYETNSAITCFTNILRENEDETFTILSANDEMRMLDGHGYHYESVQFLRDMEGDNYKKTLTIPTKKIYIFIEKIPIDYSIVYKGSGQLVSAEGASYPLIYSKGLGVYMGQNRWIIMSRMYYWAMAFKRAYGKELKIYYEDEGFVCYEIEQNPYRLYDLSIDYWFNTQLWDLR